jgi:hemin uptake protein HemP
MIDPMSTGSAKNLPPDEIAPSASLAESASPAENSVRSISSEELFAGQRIVRIQHAGEEYRLMITRNDRLILQK